MAMMMDEQGQVFGDLDRWSKMQTRELWRTEWQRSIDARRCPMSGFESLNNQYLLGRVTFGARQVSHVTGHGSVFCFELQKL